jgi:hypothetical protein
MSTFGKVFFGEESEKATEEKPVEKLGGEKPSEQPQPKPKPKIVRFRCDYCGRDGHKGKFCFRRKREERMATEWANKDKYHPPNGVLEPRVQMLRAKAGVSTVRLGESERLQEVLLIGLHWSDRCVTTVRPVQVWADRGVVFVPVMSLCLVVKVMVLVVGLDSLQVVSFLSVIPVVLNTAMGGVVALRW